MATIFRLYDTYEAAAEAVRHLLDAGIPRSDISVVSNNSENWYSTNSDRGIIKNATVDRDRDGRAAVFDSLLLTTFSVVSPKRPVRAGSRLPPSRLERQTWRML